MKYNLGSNLEIINSKYWQPLEGSEILAAPNKIILFAVLIFKETFRSCELSG